MKTYELVIEERQPSCGGKSPFKSRILSVTTDDPVAYVKDLEKENPFSVTTREDGTIVMETEHNGMGVKYEFTED